MADSPPTREELESSIAALEAQREILGEALDPALAALRAQLDALSVEVPDTGDQRKQITVLFADVKGFTSMSLTMDPEDVAEVMNTLWAEIDHVITKNGGRVDKHIGDAVMALFGAPIAHEDDPERAVRTALAMQETIKDVVESHGGPEVANLQMRVGINTGLAMLGTVGSNEEYTAIGHTVNLASRLESLAPPGGVQISQATMNQTAGLFNVEATEPLTVKGVEGTVQAYLVKGAKPRTFRVGPREVAGIPTRMIGRDEELELLKSLLPDDPNGEPGETNLVTIIGDPGVGKSRLVYEYFNHLEANPYPVWLFRGRAIESSRETTYSVLRSIVFDRFLIADSDTPEEAKEKLETGMAAYMGVEAAMAAPVLGYLVGLDYTDDPVVSGLLDDPKVIRDKGFKAVLNMLVSGCVDTFVVFLVEDIHWADPESLDLLEYLSDEATELPLVLLCTARPDIAHSRPEWDRAEPGRLSIRLDRLDADETDALIEDVLQRLGSAPAELKELISQRSEGNPFFLEELVKMLIDEGVIDTTGEEWSVHVEALNRTTIPGTLTGVLQARLDSLPRVERGVLQRSSVVGRVFWEAASDHLAAAAAGDGGRGDTALLDTVAPSLKQHEMAYERDPSAFAFTREFIFKHAILHDVAYESVVRKLRRVYHRETANWLIDVAKERGEEFAGQIAEHFDQAGESREAVNWLIKAGDRARRAHAPEAAIRSYNRAIEIIRSDAYEDSTEPKMAALGGLGDVLTSQARYEEAIEVYAELSEEAGAADDDLVTARARRGMATAETHRGHPKEALDNAVLSREAARRSGDEKAVAQALFLEAWANMRLGSFEEGVNLAADMLSISRELADKPLLAEALNLQGVIAAGTGSYEEASKNFSEAASIYKKAGNEEKEMPIVNNLGVIAELRGDFAAAEERYTEALRMAEETSDRDAQLVYSSNLGGVMIARGRTAEGEVLLREVVEMAPGEFSLLSETYQFLADALTDQGKWVDAQSAGETSLALALEAGSPDHIAGAWRALGALASAQGRPLKLAVNEEIGDYEAEVLFEKSLEVAKSVESDADIAKTLTSWAFHDMRSGDVESCERNWSEAKEIYLALGAEPKVEQFQARLDSLRPA